jgi:coenzyme F420-reducing hydrogenase delta subunit/Pyruvate/2-oxoacid:ferredoxin oxidoreductase delta subunit
MPPAAAKKVLVEEIGAFAGAARDAGIEVQHLGPEAPFKRIMPTGVWESVCSDCIICEQTCPMLRFDREHKYMTVNQVACKGCGVCVPACPTGALQQPALRYGLAAAELAHALGKDISSAPNSCNECVATGGENVAPEGPAVKVLCSGRFEPAMALEALNSGCQGVLVTGCLMEGVEFRRNEPILGPKAELAKELMGLLGIDAKRLGLIDSAPGEEGFMEAVSSFLAGLTGDAA